MRANSQIRIAKRRKTALEYWKKTLEQKSLKNKKGGPLTPEEDKIKRKWISEQIAILEERLRGV